MRVTKVTTKRGDLGRTSLVGGDGISKAHPRIEALGEIDELNSYLGVILSGQVDVVIRELLTEIQQFLFIAGADIGTPSAIDVPRVGEEHIGWVEDRIKILNSGVNQLEEFILPGGTLAGARLHVARCLARRAERRVVLLSEGEQINSDLLIFINRLSDLLFVMARITNRNEGVQEVAARFSQKKK